MQDWYLQPILDSYLLVAGVIVALLALAWWVVPRFPGVDVARRRKLWWLRVLAIAVLLLLALRPVLVRTRTRTLPTSLAIAFDVSQSMQVADGPQGESRWARAQALLQSLQPQLSGLPQDVKLRLFAFDGTVRQITHDVADVSVDGRETDLGGAIRSVLAACQGEPLRALVLLTDGAQRVIEPKADAPSMARELGRQEVPLMTVCFGRGRNQTQARDVAMETLPDAYSVFIKNQLTLTAGVRIAGYVNQAIPVRLLAGRDGEIPIEVDAVSVMAQQDGERLDVELSFVPEQPGDYQLIVQADLQNGELVEQNNRIVSFATVRDGGLRVLYLHGNLLREQFYLRDAWNTSQDIDLHARYVDRRFPPSVVSVPELDAEYDVYVLEDVDAAMLGTEQLQRLRDRIGQGAGLAMLGGYHSQGPGGYKNSPLDAILPLEMDVFERQSLDPNEPIREDIRFGKPVRLVPAVDHPILTIPEDWRELPPLVDALRWVGVKHDAVVLARDPQQRPLLAVRRSAGGPVLAFAGDSTYRWLLGGYPETHKRFWRQMLLWLANRDDQPSDPLALRLARRRLGSTDSLPVRVQWRDPEGQLVVPDELKATLRGPGGERNVPFAVDPSQRSPGIAREWSATLADLPRAGLYQLVVSVPAGAPEAPAASARFYVQDRNLELEQPAANPQFLAALSDYTRASGGSLVAAENLPGRLQEILKRPTLHETAETDRWQFGDRPRDGWIGFLIMAGILSLEWWLRKRWGMV